MEKAPLEAVTFAIQFDNRQSSLSIFKLREGGSDAGSCQARAEYRSSKSRFGRTGSAARGRADQPIDQIENGSLKFLSARVCINVAIRAYYQKGMTAEQRPCGFFGIFENFPGSRPPVGRALTGPAKRKELRG